MSRYEQDVELNKRDIRMGARGRPEGTRGTWYASMARRWSRCSASRLFDAPSLVGAGMGSCVRGGRRGRAGLCSEGHDAPGVRERGRGMNEGAAAEDSKGAICPRAASFKRFRAADRSFGQKKRRKRAGRGRGLGIVGWRGGGS